MHACSWQTKTKVAILCAEVMLPMTLALAAQAHLCDLG